MPERTTTPAGSSLLATMGRCLVGIGATREEILARDAVGEMTECWLSSARRADWVPDRTSEPCLDEITPELTRVPEISETGGFSRLNRTLRRSSVFNQKGGSIWL